MPMDALPAVELERTSPSIERCPRVSRRQAVTGPDGRATEQRLLHGPPESMVGLD